MFEKLFMEFGKDITIEKEDGTLVVAIALVEKGKPKIYVDTYNRAFETEEQTFFKIMPEDKSKISKGDRIIMIENTDYAENPYIVKDIVDEAWLKQKHNLVLITTENLRATGGL